MSAHLAEWTLRRLRAGELPGGEAQQARSHVATCAECQRVLHGLEEEQARFEAQVPFERFAAGVEGALKQPKEPASQPRVNGLLVAVAALVLLAVTVRPLLEPESVNRLKGSGASATLRIGGEGPQRAVLPGDTETVLPHERVRIGYTAGPYPFILALSLDDTGEVSPLYATEDQRSLRVEPGAGRHWLPDSVSFTGTGNERVMVLLSNEPLELREVAERALRAWEEAGNQVSAMSPLELGGVEIDWVLHKP
ncbi:ACP synthase [Cystobacter ferrugineus]|uniref:ACP synthase n=1 Tax=Cystobacter ferrugineus TaxID=83449 RepID=A0A1L9B7R8_9BACT|nr:ACP synthase [Cystobacter ferrugineus]OJH38291.1 ACP synthase [Cystobacter ferrugineus]